MINVKKKIVEQGGVTLIALMVTVIVIIILAAISIKSLSGNDGILNRAKNVKTLQEETEEENEVELAYLLAVSQKTKESVTAEDVKKMLEASKNIDGKNATVIGNSNLFLIGFKDTERKYCINNGVISRIENEKLISNETSFVGSYADINGDGTIDGIIYIDLLAQEGLTERWKTTDGNFKITSEVTTSNVKDYVISQEKVVDSRFDNTERDVIKLADFQTGTEDRFYVMGLSLIKDGTNNKLLWYKNAYNNMTDYATIAPDTINIGTGRKNTAMIKEKCTLQKGDSGYYGAVNSRDLWAYLPTEPKAGANLEESLKDKEPYRWFLASRAEWSAFGYNLGITVDNYADYHLYATANYWTSTIKSENSAFAIIFNKSYASGNYVSNANFFRASATF